MVRENDRRTWHCTKIAIGVIAALALTSANGFAGTKVKRNLNPTVHAPGGRGQVTLTVKHHGKTRQGQFKVVARNLTPGATFSVNVAGVHIGTLTTNAAGAGLARFSNPRHGNDQFLGVDPHGDLVEVMDDQGEDMMDVEMPEDTEDAGDIQCCVADEDGESECEEETPEECQAQNGVNMGTGTCFPDPCGGSEPPENVVCCLPNEDGPECDETDAADCAAENGVTVMASSCEPDPCPPPTSPDIVRCCIAEDSGDSGDGEDDNEDNQAECEQLSTAECADENGTPMGTGSCDPNPCAMTTTTSTTNTTTTL
ncbi:MAG TPA: hypothetical protein VLI07_06875 [Candidatus Binatus sp.]|nr:hypothetical protein [Candidatus Binatus sp.]